MVIINQQLALILVVVVATAALLGVEAAIGQQPQVRPCYNTFASGCRDMQTSTGLTTCCRTIVGMATSDRQCLCEIFGFAKFTNQKAIYFVNGCGGHVNGSTICPNLPAGKLTVADLVFDPRSIVDALLH